MRITSVRRILSVSLTVIVLLLLTLPLTHVNAVTAPLMGDATMFAVLGGSTVTNTGNSVITGNLGLYPGTSITGFPPGIVVPPGTIYQTTTEAADAQSATATAYDALVAQAPGTTISAGILGGQTLVAGVYTVPAATTNLVGTLTLDAGGDPTAVWVFLMPSTLITSSSSVVSFKDGIGSPCNVFWQVTSSATLGASSAFVGSILALESISLGNAASVSGRLLPRNGAVTLINNAVTLPPCAGFIAGGVGVSKIFSPSTIGLGGVSTLNITFTNTDTLSAILSFDFTDTLPIGLVIADTPNLHFYFGGVEQFGEATATPGGSTVTLLSGSSIPGGSVSMPGVAVLMVDVTSQLADTYVNTLAAGALRTDKGNNVAPTGATLAVSTPVGGYLHPINKAQILSTMLVEGLSGNWWLSAIAAIVAVAATVFATVVLRRHRS